MIHARRAIDDVNQPLPRRLNPEKPPACAVSVGVPLATAGPGKQLADLLGKVAMACAKADTAITRLYVDTLGTPEHRALLDQLLAEQRRTVEWLARVRQAELLDDQPVLDAAIDLRNPYVDPLSLLQVALLRRIRELPEEHPDREALQAAIGTCLNGVAQGLRNTG